MNPAPALRLPSLEEAATYSPQTIVDLVHSQFTLMQEVQALKHQLDWFKRQLFGQKSERRIVDSAQLSLGEAINPGEDSASPDPVERTVAAHTRKVPTRKGDAGEDSLPFFDETRVPIEVIELKAPEAQGLDADDYEVIRYKESFRLAQRPGSYVILKYRRPVIKLKASEALVCAAAPSGVIEGSRADVSFIAGLLIDKFAYHLPLYRLLTPI
jgi:transposase